MVAVSCGLLDHLTVGLRYQPIFPSSFNCSMESADLASAFVYELLVSLIQRCKGGGLLVACVGFVAVAR